MALRDQLLNPDIFHDHAQFKGGNDRVHRLMDVLLGIRQPDAAAYVLEALKAGRFEKNRLGEFVHFVTRYVADDNWGAVADYVLSWQHADVAEQLSVFRSFGLATAERGGQIPAPCLPWARRLAAQLVNSNEQGQLVPGMELVGALHLKELYEPVAAIAMSAQRPAELRVAAIRACVASADPRRLRLLDTLLGNPEEDTFMRRAAALALSTINTDEARELLLTRLQTAHHLLAADIAAALAGTRTGAELLLSMIGDGKASAWLLREPAVQRRLEIANVSNLAARVDQLTEDLPPPDQLTAQRIAHRRNAFLASNPDKVIGKGVFEKQCQICHQLGGEGKKFGPDLDGIGVRGLDRLLEDLLDPNRNVDPAFQSTIVVTDKGITHSGLALRDEGKVLVLVDADGNEVRINHGEIDERYTSTISPMPNAIEKSFEADEFNHLMRFLLEIQEDNEHAGEQ
jgi:putative heme-binding domain-containing protein